jgi:rhodanese-related sulfurtransferase
MKRTMILVITLAGVFLAACSGWTNSTVSEETPGGEVPASDGSYTDIQVSELQGMLENKDFPLVNVHIPFEGNLPDTDLSIPFDEIENHLDQLPADKDAKIVLYCRSGRMSSIAAETLAGLGYTNVYNLEGGFNAWERAGLPLVGK